MISSARLEHTLAVLTTGNARRLQGRTDMNTTTTLVIMAAGIGARYGAGVKQLAKVGPKGQIIMDYAVHDAIEAGFNQIVFIIRKDIKEEFSEVIGRRIEEVCHQHNVSVAYAFQKIDDLPGKHKKPEGRTKPWGTGKAVLSCHSLVEGPFAVINADDYYGKEAFVKVHDFLTNLPEDARDTYCMAGFVLENTLSEHGQVTRGLCQVDEEKNLLDIHETHDIGFNEDHVPCTPDRVLDPLSHVSMNMWGFTGEFMDYLETGFNDFLTGVLRRGKGDPMKEEFLIPVFVQKLLKENRINVKVLETGDSWFGVTYQEDRDSVEAAFADLTKDGIYTEELFDDLS